MMKTITYRLLVTAALFAFAAGLAFASLGILETLSAQAADGDEVKEADIIVQFDDSDVIIRPITFTGQISGLRALELTGLDLVTTDTQFGTALCAIEGKGCPVEDCFCGGNTFWNYAYWNIDDWLGYPVGASGSIISETDAVEGYRWGKWGEEPAPAPDVQAAQRGLEWLQARQSAVDGSYSNVSSSLDVMLAAAANHLDANGWRSTANTPSLMDFVAVSGRNYSLRGVSESGKLAAAVTAGDGCWPVGAALPSAYYSPTLGSLSDQAGFLSWAILGTVALSQPVPSDSVAYLQSMALPSGGWEWSPGWGADTNSTAVAIQALVAGGVPVSATEVVSGLAYLKSSQNSDGGFPYQPDSPFGTDSDSNSSAWIVQAILAAGQDPRSGGWEAGENSPVDFLLSTQLSDGSFEYQNGQGSDEFATRQVVQALLGSTHPMRVQSVTDCLGDIGGKIVDGDGNGVEGAKVVLEGGLQVAALGASAYMTETVTGLDGGYRFEGVPVGYYLLAVTLPDESDPSQVLSVMVRTGSTTDVPSIDATERRTYLPSMSAD